MEQLLFDFIEQYIPLTTEEKETLVSFNIFSSVKKGDLLLKEGELSKKSFFVLKGYIRSFYVINGEEKTTGFYTELEGLTPHCVTNKEPSEYYIEACEDGIISSSTPDMEIEIFNKFPKFETLCRVISEELVAKQQIDFNEFRISSPEKRYLNLQEKRPDLLQRVPQHQLASYLGIKPQSLSRLKTRLMKKDQTQS